MSARRVMAGLALAGCAWGAAGSAAGSISAVRPASGIAGRIEAGPTCPVERLPPDPRCAPRPLSARVRIRRAGDAHALKVIRSAANGHFRVRLSPGVYILTPLRSGSAFPRPPGPMRERVRSGHFTRVTIVYDTGIR